MLKERFAPELPWYDVNEMVEALEREVAGIHPVKRRAYLKEVRAAFDQWKQEHGQRIPPNAHKRALACRPWLSFDQAIPYQTGGFGVFNSIDLCFKLWLDEYPPLQPLIEKVRIDKLLALVALDDKTTDGRSSSLVSVVCLNLRYKGIWFEAYERAYRQVLLDWEVLRSAHLRQIRALEGGRPQGATANKLRASECSRLWRKISEELVFAQPTWTLARHVRYIQKQDVGRRKDGQPYASATIRNAIKGIRSEVDRKLETEASRSGQSKS